MVWAKVAGLGVSATLLPIVGQIDADTWVGKLEKGSAQVILSVVVVALATALVRVALWQRQDSQARVASAEEQGKALQSVMAANAVANEKQAQSAFELTEAVHTLNDTIKRCPARNT